MEILFHRGDQPLARLRCNLPKSNGSPKLGCVLCAWYEACVDEAPELTGERRPTSDISSDKPQPWEGGLMMARRRFASLLFATSLLLPLSASAITIDVNGLLTGPGFNSGDPPLGLFTTTISNRWLQESAVLVVGPENGVSPNEADGMLRIQNSVLTASQVRQVISVSVLPGDVAIFRMKFNSPVAGAIGGAILSAYGAGTVGAGAPLLGQGLSGATLLDANPLTWETLSVGSFVLPVGTTQLEAQVFFTNGTIPQNGYVDAVPEPSTLLLTALGLFGMAVRYRRQRGTDSARPGC